jgi:hypothetical protein
MSITGAAEGSPRPSEVDLGYLGFRSLSTRNTNNRNLGVDLLRHDVLLVFGAPCQLQSLAGQ